MEKENIKINFVHICDMAFLSQEGKANIIGLFKAIYSKSFPATHPKFAIISSIKVKGVAGSYKQFIKIIRDEDNEIISSPVEISFDIKDQKEHELNFIADVVNTPFQKPGKYKIVIFLDNLEIYSMPLELIKI